MNWDIVSQYDFRESTLTICRSDDYRSIRITSVFHLSIRLRYLLIALVFAPFCYLLTKRFWVVLTEKGIDVAQLNAKEFAGLLVLSLFLILLMFLVVLAAYALVTRSVPKSVEYNRDERSVQVSRFSGEGVVPVDELQVRYTERTRLNWRSEKVRLERKNGEIVFLLVDEHTQMTHGDGSTRVRQLALEVSDLLRVPLEL